MKRHVIVGNGGAGISAARAIRTVTVEDEVVIVSHEDCRAYSPVLETHYLAGHISFDEMFFVDEGFYRLNGIRTVLGKRAYSVDLNARVVCLEDDDCIGFTNLLIATGSETIVPRIPGVEGRGIFNLRSADDARRIDRWARGEHHAVVIGAGLIGMQAVDALTRRGLSVTIVEKLNQVMPLVLDAGGAAIVQRALCDRGVDVRLGDGVRRIEDLHGRKAVSLESGQTIEGDLVILATGVRPVLGLAQSCGLRVGRGILVDEFARTSAEGVYAAGDVAEGPDSVSGSNQINATWFNATEQGRAAGLNMVGVRTEYTRNVRMNISFPLDIPFASVGLTDRASEQQEEVRSESNGRYRKLIFEGDRLVGAVLVGDVEEIGILNTVLKSQDSLRFPKAGLLAESAYSCFARNFFVNTGSNRS